MALDSMFDIPLLTYSAMRSAGFSLEYRVLNTLSRLLPGSRERIPSIDPALQKATQRELYQLLRQDAANIREGVYPLQVLKPESPITHLARIPKIMADGLSLSLRRMKGRTTVFDPSARDYLDELPRYYRRNFHFQTNGYLSSESAEIYDHQVEMLFGGAADAMRRLIIRPMREHFSAAANRDGKGLHFLEIAAGTGSTTQFVRQAFPKARITAVDLSYPYLKIAQRRMSRFSRVDFMQADGADLPFEGGRFDAVYSVFLFHELPLEARKEVFAESARVLKPGGFVGCVDSLQGGDVKDFDPLLKTFPQAYHEPFFRNYLEHPLPDLMQEAGFAGIQTGRGFLSKVCWSGK